MRTIYCFHQRNVNMIIPACIQNLKWHRMIRKSSSYIRDSEKLETKNSWYFFFSLIILVTQKASVTVSVLRACRNLARHLFRNTHSDNSGSWHPLLPRKETGPEVLAVLGLNCLQERNRTKDSTNLNCYYSMKVQTNTRWRTEDLCCFNNS